MPTIWWQPSYMYVRFGGAGRQPTKNNQESNFAKMFCLLALTDQIDFKALGGESATAEDVKEKLKELTEGGGDGPTKLRNMLKGVTDSGFSDGDEAKKDATLQGIANTMVNPVNWQVRGYSHEALAGRYGSECIRSMLFQVEAANWPSGAQFNQDKRDAVRAYLGERAEVLVDQTSDKNKGARLNKLHKTMTSGKLNAPSERPQEGQEETKQGPPPPTRQISTPQRPQPDPQGFQSPESAPSPIQEVGSGKPKLQRGVESPNISPEDKGLGDTTESVEPESIMPKTSPARKRRGQDVPSTPMTQEARSQGESRSARKARMRKERQQQKEADERAAMGQEDKAGQEQRTAESRAGPPPGAQQKFEKPGAPPRASGGAGAGTGAVPPGGPSEAKGAGRPGPSPGQQGKPPQPQGGGGAEGPSLPGGGGGPPQPGAGGGQPGGGGGQEPLLPKDAKLVSHEEAERKAEEKGDQDYLPPAGDLMKGIITSAENKKREDEAKKAAEEDDDPSMGGGSAGGGGRDEPVAATTDADRTAASRSGDPEPETDAEAEETKGSGSGEERDRDGDWAGKISGPPAKEDRIYQMCQPDMCRELFWASDYMALLELMDFDVESGVMYPNEFGRAECGDPKQAFQKSQRILKLYGRTLKVKALFFDPQKQQNIHPLLLCREYLELHHAVQVVLPRYQKETKGKYQSPDALESGLQGLMDTTTDEGGAGGGGNKRTREPTEGVGQGKGLGKHAMRLTTTNLNKRRKRTVPMPFNQYII